MNDPTPLVDPAATLPAAVRDRLAAIARNAQAALDGDLSADQVVDGIRRMASDCRGILCAGDR